MHANPLRKVLICVILSSLRKSVFNYDIPGELMWSETITSSLTDTCESVGGHELT